MNNGKFINRYSSVKDAATSVNGTTSAIADFVSNNQTYNARDIECLVARALLHGNKVVINADW